MIKSEDLPAGEIYLRLDKDDIINESTGKELLGILNEKIKSAGKFIIDIGSVKKINSDGFHYLNELMKCASDNRAIVYFTNIDNTLEDLIQSITLTDES